MKYFLLESRHKITLSTRLPRALQPEVLRYLCHAGNTDEFDRLIFIMWKVLLCHAVDEYVNSGYQKYHNHRAQSLLSAVIGSQNLGDIMMLVESQKIRSQENRSSIANGCQRIRFFDSRPKHLQPFVRSNLDMYNTIIDLWSKRSNFIRNENATSNTNTNMEIDADIGGNNRLSR